MNFKVEKINLTDLPITSNLVKSYLNKQDQELEALYNFAPDETSVINAIEDSKKNNTNRELLFEVLTQQYKGKAVSEKTAENIAALKNENTFSICTAHQLNLFTGPLYLIYKIVSAINASNILNNKFPQYNFVPVYYLGSEDHDFEEINHLNLFRKKVEWESNENGATGNFALNGIENALDEVIAILGEDFENSEVFQNLKQSYNSSKNLADAHFKFVNHLFAAKGLIIINADDKSFKHSFIDKMEQELFGNSILEESKTAIEFLNNNYKVQANPRAINLFYMKNGLRERIEKVGSNFKVVKTELAFTEAELKTELHNFPERFSPNVLFRPMYQQHILPAPIFIGGNGELAYWLQLKDTFKSFEVHFPILLPRDSAVFLSKKSSETWLNFNFENIDFFNDSDALSKLIVKGSTNFNTELNEELEQIISLKTTLVTKGKAINKDLEKTIETEFTKIEKGLKNLESKFVRAAKRESETLISKKDKVLQEIFPQGKFQERHLNFMQFYNKYGNVFFDLLFENFNPFELSLKIFKEE